VDSPIRGLRSGAGPEGRFQIDSLFSKVYTGPPKPPVIGDLAGLEWPAEL
jgi:hypothetical protein